MVGAEGYSAMKKYVFLIPALQEEYGLPCWGDKLIIKNCEGPILRITEQKLERALTSTPKNSKSGTSMAVLLCETTRKLESLAVTNGFRESPLMNADELRLGIKALLENYRSVLDYLSGDIASLVPAQRNKKKLYFPMAGSKETKQCFETRIKIEFPDLDIKFPRLFQFLIEIQRFDDSPWLDQLGSLVNEMKHNRLIDLETVTCKTNVIHHNGVGINIGECGLSSLDLGENITFSITSPSGITKKFWGAQTIDVTTTRLFNTDPEIVLDRYEWKTFGLVGTSRSAIGLLAEIDVGVRRACTEVTRHMPLTRAK